MHPVGRQHGVIVKLPLNCGTCGRVGDVAIMEWCAACGQGMCPTCMPPGQESLPRCGKCLAECRPTAMEEAGRREAEAREAMFWQLFSKVQNSVPQNGPVNCRGYRLPTKDPFWVRFLLDELTEELVRAMQSAYMHVDTSGLFGPQTDDGEGLQFRDYGWERQSDGRFDLRLIFGFWTVPSWIQYAPDGPFFREDMGCLLRPLLSLPWHPMPPGSLAPYVGLELQGVGPDYVDYVQPLGSQVVFRFPAVMLPTARFPLHAVLGRLEVHAGGHWLPLGDIVADPEWGRGTFLLIIEFEPRGNVQAMLTALHNERLERDRRFRATWKLPPQSASTPANRRVDEFSARLTIASSLDSRRPRGGPATNSCLLVFSEIQEDLQADESITVERADEPGSRPGAAPPAS